MERDTLKKLNWNNNEVVIRDNMIHDEYDEYHPLWKATILKYDEKKDRVLVKWLAWLDDNGWHNEGTWNGFIAPEDVISIIKEEI